MYCLCIPQAQVEKTGKNDDKGVCLLNWDAGREGSFFLPYELCHVALVPL